MGDVDTVKRHVDSVLCMLAFGHARPFGIAELGCSLSDRSDAIYSFRCSATFAGGSWQ